jgi:hypothetical protein
MIYIDTVIFTVKNDADQVMPSDVSKSVLASDKKALAGKEKDR